MVDAKGFVKLTAELVNLPLLFNYELVPYYMDLFTACKYSAHNRS